MAVGISTAMDDTRPVFFLFLCFFCLPWSTLTEAYGIFAKGVFAVYIYAVHVHISMGLAKGACFDEEGIPIPYPFYAMADVWRST